MAGRIGAARRRAVVHDVVSLPPDGAIWHRSECLAQLLSAFRDIADFDDIHQAAERLNAVQAWIRREARAAAADPLFDDEHSVEFRPSHATA